MYSYVKLTAEFKENWSHDPKINTTSGMTSSIRNLGKFGQTFKIGNSNLFEYASDEVLPHLYEKIHLDCIEIESKDRQ